MRYIKRFNEIIKIDIKVGDTVLGGRFLNKKIKVKKIGKNKKGDLRLNGKPLLRFRIIDQESVKENSLFPDTSRASKDKYFNEVNNILHKMKDEIEEFSFIIQDTNSDLDIKINPHYNAPENSWIAIIIRNLIAGFHAALDEFSIECDEYCDRVNEIGKKNGFKTLRKKIGKKYIVIYILNKDYDTTAMEESGVRNIEESNSIVRKNTPIECVRKINESNKIDSLYKIKKEIEEISFILTDINSSIDNIKIYKNGIDAWSYFKIYFPKEKWESNEDEFHEFCDRIVEIANKYGFKIEYQICGPEIAFYIINKKYQSRGAEVDDIIPLYESFRTEKWCVDQILEEIIPLEYILNDDGLEVEINPYTNGQGDRQSESGSSIIIKFIPPKMDYGYGWDEGDDHNPWWKVRMDNKSTYKSWLAGLTQRESYIEYYDRVKDIVEKYGYKITNKNIYDIEIYPRNDIRESLIREYKEEEEEEEDHVIYKVEKEINNILYILNDEGLYPTVEANHHRSDYKSGWIDINLPYALSNNAAGVSDSKSESYIEFCDRLKEIVEKFGYKLAKSKFGYLLVFDPKNPKYKIEGRTLNQALIIESKKENAHKDLYETDSIIYKIEKEIKDILYIFSDEGLILPKIYPEYRKKVPKYGTIAGLCIHPLGMESGYIDIHFNTSTVSTPFRRVEFYDELLDRIVEIAKKYGYIAATGSDGRYLLIIGPDFLNRYKKGEGNWSDLTFESKNLDESDKFSLENLKKEIKYLEYILNDDGIIIKDYESNNYMARGKYIIINLQIPKEIRNLHGYFTVDDRPIAKWARRIKETESFIEWCDRVNEVSERFGYRAKIGSDGDGSPTLAIYNPNYIFWKQSEYWGSIV